MGVRFPKRERLAVEGGLRSDSRRGAFAQSWWGKRWIDGLERSNDDPRLGRGRTYARQGQIASIEVTSGLVVAKVQGTRKQPYKVVLKAEKIPLQQWQEIAQTLSADAAMTASLLASNLPEEIESVFLKHHCTLFPTCLKKWEVDCSCPDWATPCKHIAAVYYLLAEEIDRDPFLLFQLLGIKFSVFLSLLEEEAGTEREAVASDPLPLDLKRFWHGIPTDVKLPKSREPSGSTLLNSLGKFPFWRGEKPLKKELEPLYTRTTEALQKSS